MAEGRDTNAPQGAAANPPGESNSIAIPVSSQLPLAEQLKLLPAKPGVYLMKNAEGKIIYVGKARSLKNRVRQYFQSSRNLAAKVLSMVAQVADIELITTDTEVEALILESNLIKKYKPKYNIRLRDDKNYPYLKLNPNERWPRLTVARQVKKDGARYFGPYTTATAMWETLKLARRLFPLRTCNRVDAHSRPCLQYHIGRCLAPCLKDFGRQPEYEQTVRDLILFLEGKGEDLVKTLNHRMDEAAENLQFERAAELRDQLKAIEFVTQQQKIVSPGLEDQDALGYATDGGDVCVQVFFIRGGKLMGREHFILPEAADLSGPEIMDAFLPQFYGEAGFIPREVLVQDLPTDADLIETWLRELRRGAVNLHQPRRGEKKDLLHMVADNARLVLRDRKAQREQDEVATTGAVAELQQALDLPLPPARIECYDISHVQGSEVVASMVVFLDGKPKKSDYRRFKIRHGMGNNDFLSMAEVIRRRFKKGLDERAALVDTGLVHSTEAKAEAKFADFPDLVIIDGGKGQLGAARDVMRELGVEHIPAFGLAKENEELFREGQSDPIVLPRHSPALHLVQRVRDEAHRFAITYHRKLHAKAATYSVLDDVPGVGPVRKKALLRHFGSAAALKRATAAEIAAVEGIGGALAEVIKEHLGGR
ncbi:MAG: excinuclease ABC subunit UvrC [Symbiobacteriia bacterium]